MGGREKGEGRGEGREDIGGRGREKIGEECDQLHRLLYIHVHVQLYSTCIVT